MLRRSDPSKSFTLFIHAALAAGEIRSYLRSTGGRYSKQVEWRKRRPRHGDKSRYVLE